MKRYDTDLWVQNLEAIYQQALKAKPVKPFFLCIYDYVNYVLTTDKLDKLSDIFYTEKKADYKTLDRYKKKLIDQIEDIIPKLKEYKSKDQVEKTKIEDILSIKKGSGPIFDPEGWTSIFKDMEKIAINAIGHKEVDREIFKILGVEEYNNREIRKWKIGSAYRNYEEEEAKVKRIRETRNWWSWNRLRLFYEMYDDKEGIKKEIVKSKGWLPSTNLICLENEIKAIVKDVPQDELKIFTYDSYLMHLQKIHRQLLNGIAKFKRLLEEKDKAKIPFYFDENKATILIKNKEIKFKKDGDRITLLKILMEKRKGIYCDEVLEELEGVISNKKDTDIKNGFYELYRGIQIRFVKNGITDFLNYGSNHIKINPIYKLEKQE